MDEKARTRKNVLTAPIDVIHWSEAEDRIASWAEGRNRRYICICNVHSIVTADEDTQFREVIRGADLATPDGMPVAWMLRALGFRGQERINGPDLLWRLCRLFSKNGTSVYFYGGSEATQKKLHERLSAAFPELRIAGMVSPPFRQLTGAEDEAYVKAMNESGAGVVFVSLGCPKQEYWMAAHRKRINAVLIGVGAAFDYHAGTLRRAPVWMRQMGLEWFFRLAKEPGRLWRRYLGTNSLFILRAARQLMSHYRRSHRGKMDFSAGK
jgi:N-acetylglucosaminyldiphosphoundecaprenol N-acetyl-beta-D-mannosaminyltransferase